MQTGGKGHLVFLHMGHADFRDKMKPCCRDIPLSHPRLSEVFSVRADSSITEWLRGLGSWRFEKVSSETATERARSETQRWKTEKDW